MNKQPVHYLVRRITISTVLIVLLAGCSVLYPPQEQEVTAASLTFSYEGTTLTNGDTIDFGALTGELGLSDLQERIIITVADENTFFDNGWSVEVTSDDFMIDDTETPFFFVGSEGHEGKLSFGDEDEVDVSVEYRTEAIYLISNGEKTGSVTFFDSAGTELISLDLTANLQKVTGHLYDLTDDATGDTGTDYQIRIYDPATRIVLQKESSIGSTGGSALINGTYTYPTTSYPSGLTGTTNAPLDNGQYYLRFHLDADTDESVDLGDVGLFEPLTVDGDMIIDYETDDFETAVEEPFTMTNGGSLPDGSIVFLFLAPGSGSLQDPYYLIASRTAALNSGTISAPASGAVFPGTYDLYVYIDEDNGRNLGSVPFNWDIDSGEYQLELASVSITGAGTTIDGDDFTQVP